MSKFYYLTQKQIPNYAAKVAILRDESVRLKLGLIILAGILAMIGIYIFLANSLASKNFALKIHGERLREIRREHTRLEIEIASKKSLELLKIQGEALGLAVPKNLQYIESDSPVARK